MIKRIKSIRQLGLFSSFPNGGSLEWKKLTFIFGFNAFGKSTLCDIFKSLGRNDCTIIQKRKTIPNDSITQKIVLSVQDGTQEKDLMFESNSWHNNCIAEKLEVFDSTFIHDNVFTGLAIERKNKENFTDFILGAESVSIANKIGQLKKDLAEKKRRLKDVTPPYVAGKTDKEIKDFVNIKVELSLNDIRVQLFEKEDQKKRLEENLRNQVTVLSMNEPDNLPILSYKYEIEMLEQINQLVTFEYKGLHENAISRVQEHIKLRLCNNEEAEEWLHKGLLISNIINIPSEKFCPFCGQSLSSSLDLINIYTQYFDAEYASFIDKINKDIEFEGIGFTFDLSKKIGNVIIECNKFLSKVENPDFKRKTNTLTILREALPEIEHTLNEEFRHIVIDFKTKLEKKRRNPQREIDPLDLDHFKQVIIEYESCAENAHDCVNILLVLIKEFKALYSSGEINTQIDLVNKQFLLLDLWRHRIEQDDNCNKYITLKKEIKNYETEIDSLITDLETSQTAYLGKYFENINKYFKKLGSTDFTIEKTTDNLGYKKVFGLKVQYKNSPIKEANLPFLFSESDRRALALSIFWARLKMKHEQGKDSIIVLDDPVTSFDDNRITNTINMLVDTCNNVSQIIVLTHYPHLLRRYNEMCSTEDACFLKISKGNTSSILARLEDREFVLSEYQQHFLKIHDFINRNSSDDVRNTLRIFFENHLRMIYYKQINDYALESSKLANLINELFNNHVIDEDTRRKLHYFRETLNPDSHIFTDNNVEDVRSFALELMEYIYSVKFETEATF